MCEAATATMVLVIIANDSNCPSRIAFGAANVALQSGTSNLSLNYVILMGSRMNGCTALLNRKSETELKSGHRNLSLRPTKLALSTCPRGTISTYLFRKCACPIGGHPTESMATFLCAFLG